MRRFAKITLDLSESENCVDTIHQLLQKPRISFYVQHLCVYEDVQISGHPCNDVDVMVATKLLQRCSSGSPLNDWKEAVWTGYGQLMVVLCMRLLTRLTKISLIDDNWFCRHLLRLEGPWKPCLRYLRPNTNIRSLENNAVYDPTCLLSLLQKILNSEGYCWRSELCFPGSYDWNGPITLVYTKLKEYSYAFSNDFREHQILLGKYHAKDFLRVVPGPKAEIGISSGLVTLHACLLSFLDKFDPSKFPNLQRVLIEVSAGITCEGGLSTLETLKSLKEPIRILKRMLRDKFGAAEVIDSPWKTLVHVKPGIFGFWFPREFSCSILFGVCIK